MKDAVNAVISHKNDGIATVFMGSLYSYCEVVAALEEIVTET